MSITAPKNVYAVFFVGEAKPTIVIAEGIERVPEILKRNQSAMGSGKMIAKLELLYSRVVE